MRKQKGFSLIELLIVVAIILIIAAIAIPELAARPHRGQRGLGRRVHPDHQHCGSHLPHRLPDHRLLDHAGCPGAVRCRRVSGSGIDQRLPVGLHPGVGFDHGRSQERLLLRSGELDHRNHAGLRLHRRRSAHRPTTAPVSACSARLKMASSALPLAPPLGYRSLPLRAASRTPRSKAPELTTQKTWPGSREPRTQSDAPQKVLRRQETKCVNKKAFH